MDSNYPKVYRKRVSELNDDIAKLQVENERLKRVANVAENIFKVASTKQPCPHGNTGIYPTSSWLCDDCFIELETALDELKAGDE